MPRTQMQRTKVEVHSEPSCSAPLFRALVVLTATKSIRLHLTSKNRFGAKRSRRRHLISQKVVVRVRPSVQMVSFLLALVGELQMY